MNLNIWVVIVAAASSFLLGGIWYSPVLFLEPWNKGMGRSETDEQPHPARVIGLSFVAACYGIDHQFANRPSPALPIDGGYLTGQFDLFGVIPGFRH